MKTRTFVAITILMVSTACSPTRIPRPVIWPTPDRAGSEGTMRIDAVVGDITEFRTDAVMFATNSLLVPNGPIQRAARVKDEDYIAALRNHGPLVAGRAVETPAGRLPATYLIHVVLPIWIAGKGHTDRASQLVEAHYAGFRVADRQHVHQLTIAPLVGNFPQTVAADAAIEAMRFYQATTIESATLMSLDRDMVQLLRERLYVDAGAE